MNRHNKWATNNKTNSTNRATKTTTCKTATPTCTVTSALSTPTKTSTNTCRTRKNNASSKTTRTANKKSTITTKGTNSTKLLSKQTKSIWTAEKIRRTQRRIRRLRVGRLRRIGMSCFKSGSFPRSPRRRYSKDALVRKFKLGMLMLSSPKVLWCWFRRVLGKKISNCPATRSSLSKTQTMSPLNQTTNKKLRGLRNKKSTNGQG
jgi:hypothetical protein